MLTSYATALIVITAVLLLWVRVQIAWRRAFPAAFGDPDVLAGRLGCAGCDRTNACDRLAAADTAGEEDCA
jgi:hypothetical protein